MSNRIIEISAAAALLVGAPALASAQTVAFGTSPVSVKSCSVNESFSGLSLSGPYSFRTGVPESTSSVAVSYTNEGNAVAKRITFAVKSGNDTQNVVAKGSFAPGVRIDRTFTTNDNANAGPEASCSVAEVEFVDGTVWRAARQDVSAR